MSLTARVISALRTPAPDAGKQWGGGRVAFDLSDMPCKLADMVGSYRYRSGGMGFYHWAERLAESVGSSELVRVAGQWAG
jgi:hypothetical protein